MLPKDKYVTTILMFISVNNNALIMFINTPMLRNELIYIFSELKKVTNEKKA